MQNIFTTVEIRDYYQKGITVISLPEMPVITDLAREEMNRLGMRIETKPAVHAAAPVPKPVVSAPAASPSDRPYPSADPPAAFSAAGKIPFKQYINGGRKMIGTFIGTPHPVMTEFMGRVGFDFLTIDSEHNAMHLETVQKMLQAIAATPAYGMVRVPVISYEALTGALDAGADALLIPQIRTVEDVQRIKEFCLYPPRGRRGVGPSRATVYGSEIMKKAQDPDKDTNIVIQIETVEAVENLDRFLEEDFIDMFFIGPGDLSMAMGIFGQFTNPKLVDTIMRILEKTKQAGKKIGIFAGNFDAACNWYSKGFDMTIINSELGILGQAVSAGIPKVRSMIGGAL